MKWTLAQLMKIQSFPYEIKDSINFKDRITEIDDILDITICTVEGTLNKVDYDTYHISANLVVTLTVECALTLEPVDYTIETSIDEVYSKEPMDDDEFQIENNTIDLNEIVWSHIIINKPIRVVREDAYSILKEKNLDFSGEFLEDDINEEEVF